MKPLPFAPILFTILLVFIAFYHSSNANYLDHLHLLANHGHFRHIFGLTKRQKLELAKKLATALLLKYRSKKFLIPLPLPLPIPIPVFNTYQPIVADPLFFKWLAVKENLAGGHFNHLGGLGGFG